ncbi:MAG: 3-deoxy-manno-octulosonate cytidylyltransferase [Fimbriimonadaceae bacterium]|nr:3-deoxy-manno-octulosonate cytidylyltransferase [Fimbriimonadaceae bacterium]
MRCLVVIPARMASTRFPGKPLVDLGGKPMVQWVWEKARASGVGDHVVVATPDDEIVSAVRRFGGDAVKTRDDHPSGTDRLAEVADSLSAEIYVNVQGDEPMVEPENIRLCARPLLEDPAVMMGSVMAECPEGEADNPAVVKVVTDLGGYALYFSRHAVPYPRNDRKAPLYKHVGLYAYRREAVLAFATWSPTPLESAESLEQLRFLEHGVKIKMSLGTAAATGVDTPEQAEAVRQALRGLS